MLTRCDKMAIRRRTKSKKETTEELVTQIIEEPVSPLVEKVEEKVEDGASLVTSEKAPEVEQVLPADEMPVEENAIVEKKVRKPVKRTKAKSKKTPGPGVKEEIKLEPVTEVTAIEEAVKEELAIEATEEAPATERFIPSRERVAKETGPSSSDEFSTGFGWVVIHGTKFEYDVVVQTDGAVIRRKKTLSRDKKAKYGHTPLTRKELKPLLDQDPKVIIIGTGQSGSMPITPKAKKLLEKRACFIGPTPAALERLEKGDRKILAVLHVTC